MIRSANLALHFKSLVDAVFTVTSDYMFYAFESWCPILATKI